MPYLKHYKYPTRRKSKHPWVRFVIIFAVLFISLVLIVRDNLKISVDEVEVFNKQIPQSFDGFKILQISDVAESEWGDKQHILIDQIEKLQYDIIIFTGDYLRNPESKNYGPIIDILDYLPKDKPIYYIVGDRDYNSNKKSKSVQYEINPSQKTELMTQMENAGAQYIYPIKQIIRGNDSIFLTGVNYKEKTFDELNFSTEEHFSICVTHTPIDYDVTKRLKSVNDKNLVEVDYDLSISGHTLAGQYRLPFLGAFYSKGRGIFPKDKYLYGLHADPKERQNYISSGIGTSGSALGRFRLFNSPEIAVITLRVQK